MVVGSSPSKTLDVSHYRIAPVLVIALIPPAVGGPFRLIDPRYIRRCEIDLKLPGQVVLDIEHPGPFKILPECRCDQQVRVVYIPGLYFIVISANICPERNALREGIEVEILYYPEYRRIKKFDISERHYILWLGFIVVIEPSLIVPFEVDLGPGIAPVNFVEGIVDAEVCQVPWPGLISPFGDPGIVYRDSLSPRIILRYGFY